MLMDNLTYPNIKQSILICILFVVLYLLFKVIFSFIHLSSLNGLLTSFFSCGSLLIIVYKIRKRGIGEVGFNFQNVKWRMVPCLLLGSMCCWLLGIFEPRISFFEDIANGMGDLIFAVKPDIFVFITMIIVAPVFEELIFRGIILDGLLKQYTPKKAIVISAILFMLPHGVGLLGVFLGGLFFGWIYYRSNNIILTMMAHASVNLCGFILRCIFTSNDGAQYLVNQPKMGNLT